MNKDRDDRSTRISAKSAPLFQNAAILLPTKSSQRGSQKLKIGHIRPT